MLLLHTTLTSISLCGKAHAVWQVLWFLPPSAQEFFSQPLSDGLTSSDSSVATN